MRNSSSKYEEIKSKHPEWSDEQIWTAVSLDMQTDTVINERGNDIDPNDTNVIKEILKGARIWLEEVLPDIFAKVALLFERLLETFEDWVRIGINYVIDVIDRFFQNER